MIDLSEEKKKLIYPYEVLRARFDIRNFFLKTVVRQVYEKTGQELSYAQMQLDAMASDMAEIRHTHSQARKLVTAAIRDMRKMCKQLDTDREVLDEKIFLELLRNATTAIFTLTPCITTKGKSFDLAESLLLITLNLLIDALISISETKAELTQIAINYSEDQLIYILNYNGEAVSPSTYPNHDHACLSFYERVKLLNGNFSQDKIKPGHNQFILQIPKPLVYE